MENSFVNSKLLTPRGLILYFAIGFTILFLFSSVFYGIPTGLLISMVTGQSKPPAGHSNFEGLCWMFMAMALPLVAGLFLFLRLSKLKNYDIEVWSLRGIITIFVIMGLASASSSILFLRDFVTVPMWFVIGMAISCIVDFEPPKRCRPKRKKTNVSDIPMPMAMPLPQTVSESEPEPKKEED